MTIDRDKKFIADNEGLLIMSDFDHLGVEGFLHTGPFSKAAAKEMMVQNGGEYQALRYVMEGNKIDHTELPDDVTSEIMQEETPEPWTVDDENDRRHDEMMDARAFG